MSGTGIRDPHAGGYLSPCKIGLSDDLQSLLRAWLAQYENAHRSGYSDVAEVERLDQIGLEIALQIKAELPGSKVQYFSDARMKLSGVPFL